VDLTEQGVPYPAPGPGCWVRSDLGLRCFAPGGFYLIGCVHEHVTDPTELCPQHAEGRWKCMECEQAGHDCPAFVRAL
jgi:hypothetical protein